MALKCLKLKVQTGFSVVYHQKVKIEYHEWKYVLHIHKI